MLQYLAEHLITSAHQEHLDCHKFADNHEGCACWTSVVVRRFTEQGWVPAQLSQGLDWAIQFYYPDYPTDQPQPALIPKAHFEGLIKGTFFGACCLLTITLYMTKLLASSNSFVNTVHCPWYRERMPPLALIFQVACICFLNKFCIFI